MRHRIVLTDGMPLVDCLIGSRPVAAVQVAGILSNNVEQLGRALGSEIVVEAARGPLIPGFAAVKEAACKAGAFGCAISGAGPTVVAVVADDEVGQAVGQAMAEAFRSSGGLEVNSVQVVALDCEGARLVQRRRSLTELAM
jgi:homoserine kinase